MTTQSHSGLYLAIQDFRRARRQASLERIMARLTGKSADLLSYEDVRQKLKVKSSAGQKRREIPLDSIVGSVGRYTDFSRSFLPRQDSDEGRWAPSQPRHSQSGRIPLPHGGHRDSDRR